MRNRKCLMYSLFISISVMFISCNNQNKNDVIGNSEELLDNGIIVTDPDLIEPSRNSNLFDHEEFLLNEINKEYSEIEEHDALENLIVYELQIPEDYFADTRYYYNYVDLNDDGVDEIIALAVGYFTSGSGGSSAVICSQVDGGVRLMQALTMMNPPFIISEEKTNGYRDIIMLHDNKYKKLIFDGESYTRVTDAEVLETIDAVAGIAIICDDIEANESNFNRYLK